MAHEPEDFVTGPRLGGNEPVGGEKNGDRDQEKRCERRSSNHLQPHEPRNMLKQTHFGGWRSLTGADPLVPETYMRRCSSRPTANATSDPLDFTRPTGMGG